MGFGINGGCRLLFEFVFRQATVEYLASPLDAIKLMPDEFFE